MARQQKLKVFRAPIGFHDVYVAAPSRKAALEAWGSEHDLFARGMAEEVADPELVRAPLARPGEIIRILRGTAAEQIAALPKARPKSSTKPKAVPADAPVKRKTASRKPPRPPKPRPDRSALCDAERALSEAERQHEAERIALAQRDAELQRERRQLQKRQEQDLARLRRELEKAQENYSRAMKGWNG